MSATGAAHPRLDSAVVRNLSYDGRGIARINGKIVFVEGMLPGEDVGFRAQRRHREYSARAG